MTEILVFLIGTAFLSVTIASPQRQIENLDRGMVAVGDSGGKVYLGWRLLKADSADIAFDVYRSTAGADAVKLNDQPITQSTNLIDKSASLDLDNVWWVRSALNGKEQEPPGRAVLSANLSERRYKSIDLQGFLDKAIQAGCRHIVIPPGRYRVTPRHRQHLVLKDLADINIVAKGVEMICTETTRALTISNCRNVTLSGLTIDYDPLPYTQGRIVKLSENNTVHDIELFDGYPRGDQVQNFKYEIFRPDTRTLRFGSYHEFRVVEKGANRIRVTRGGRYHGEKVGDIIAIGTQYAPGGQIPHAIYTTRSQNVVLEDITLYTSNCFGFLETNCERTTYRRCHIDRRTAKDDFKERSDPRIRSLDADAFHSKFAITGPQLIECTARFQADDCVNICGDYHMVMASEGPRLRVLSKGHMNIEPGDPLEVVGYDGRRLPDATAVSVSRSGRITKEELAFMARQRMHKPFTEGSLRQIYEVVIDRTVDLVRGSIIAAANRMGNGFKVTGCDFGFNRSRGILIKASHGEVSNNRLEGCVEEAIKVAPEYWWLESGSSNDVLITGNDIRHCEGMGIAVYAWAGTGGLAPAGAHNDIIIRDNRLKDVAGREIWVTSTRGLILRDNDFGESEPDIKLEHCERVATDDSATALVEVRLKDGGKGPT